MSSYDPKSTLHTRRQFMRTSILGAAASWSVPFFLESTFQSLNAQAATSSIQTATGRDHPILVIVQLAGGNDGLNTVIPHGDDAYYAARSSLSIKKDNLLKINDHIGLNENLVGLRSLYDSGNLSIVQGVGYPNPNRSHFRSTEIWQTASNADEVRKYGWLGNYFDNCCSGEDPSVGVRIGNSVPQAFAAAEPMGISFSKPEKYRWERIKKSDQAEEEIFRDLNRPEDEESMTGDSIVEVEGGIHAPDLGALDYLQRTALDAQLSSDKVIEIAKKYRSKVEYPNTKLADSLSLVGRMIAGGLPTRVFYVSQGGYDTHAGQTASHARLMTELNGALTAFCKDMKEQGNFDRVMLMTFSEFGRRVAENANGGTDHGAAAPLFVLGGDINPGIYGEHPSLTDLHRGDIIHSTDFRSVYASVLSEWLNVNPSEVLGRTFPQLGIV